MAPTATLERSILSLRLPPDRGVLAGSRLPLGTLLRQVVPGTARYLLQKTLSEGTWLVYRTLQQAYQNVCGTHGQV